MYSGTIIPPPRGVSGHEIKHISIYMLYLVTEWNAILKIEKFILYIIYYKYNIQNEFA
jgi:hypothetical protein